MGRNFNIMRQTAIVLFEQIMVDRYAFLFNCLRVIAGTDLNISLQDWC